VARLVPLPDTSSGDSDDIWANPDSEQRGIIAHLAVQGVGLKGPGPMSPEINVAKARGPPSVYSEPGDGNFNGERHGTAVQAGHRSPVCYSGVRTWDFDATSEAPVSHSHASMWDFGSHSASYPCKTNIVGASSSYDDTVQKCVVVSCSSTQLPSDPTDVPPSSHLASDGSSRDTSDLRCPVGSDVYYTALSYAASGVPTSPPPSSGQRLSSRAPSDVLRGHAASDPTSSRFPCDEIRDPLGRSQAMIRDPSGRGQAASRVDHSDPDGVRLVGDKSTPIRRTTSDVGLDQKSVKTEGTATAADRH